MTIMTLKEYRKIKKWMQKEVAATLGVTLSCISMIERGERKPSPALAQKIELMTDGAVPFKSQLLDR